MARLTGLQAPLIGAPPLSLPAAVPSLNPTSSATNDCRLYVGALALEVTSGEVQQLFSVFGPVRVEMFFDPATGKGKGFCFVEFVTAEAAKAVRPLLFFRFRPSAHSSCPSHPHFSHTPIWTL